MKNETMLRPGMIIALGFAGLILIGTVLLALPMAAYPGQRLTWAEALFESTSAVCVTGLVVVDTGTTFTVFGKIVLMLLIQIGGMGIAIAGVTASLLLRRKLSLHNASLLSESWNIETVGGTRHLLYQVLGITLGTQGVGALLTFPILLKSYPPLKAAGYSVFHAVSAFNNAGFDLFGGYSSLTGYADDVAMNLITAGIIIISGLGYLVIINLWHTRSFKRSTLQTRVVISFTAVLLLYGTLMFRVTDGYSWLQCFFQSVTARTAGFNTVDLGAMSTAGQFVMVMLMICGASPGSTGGGIKTTTVFTLLLAMRSAARNDNCQAFGCRVPDMLVRKAFVVALCSLSMLMGFTLLMCIAEPEYSFMALLFETTSAINTVGVSTGITSQFGGAARAILILTMYVGRLGPLSLATMWANPSQKRYSCPEEPMMIG